MNTLRRLIQPLNNALQMIFARDLSLRRGEAGVEIVLAERDSSGKPVVKPGRAEQKQRKDRAELELMREQLAAVLDELPETRATLRHLVFVEQALSRKGWRVLNKLPLDVLQRALDQLEGLVHNWSPEGLANLRSKMAVAIIDREHMGPDDDADAYRTSMPMDLPPPAAAAETELVEADGVSDADGDALTAAYAALGASLSEPAPAAAPSPAALAAQTLDLLHAGPPPGLAGAAGNEPLEYHSELGSPSARSQPRQRPAGTGKLEPIKLRELQG